jgi:hypothetical protein
MNKEQFKAYIASRQQLDGKFKKEIPDIDEQYNEHLEKKEKKYQREKQYVKERLAKDPEFKEAIKEKNKKHYQKKKAEKAEKATKAPSKTTMQSILDNNIVESEQSQSESEHEYIQEYETKPRSVLPIRRKLF